MRNLQSSEQVLKSKNDSVYARFKQNQCGTKTKRGEKRRQQTLGESGSEGWGKQSRRTRIETENEGDDETEVLISFFAVFLGMRKHCFAVVGGRSSRVV